ncbi:MAG: cob(I)yrinic acid a,c-diamide adenosyltransferase [Balneolaceae bacterium]
MKIYTKKGDSGNTSLFGGQTVSKSAARIESYGTVDELNSILGVVRSFEVNAQIDNWLNTVQHQLFVLGADLATPENREVRIDRISEEEITFLEKLIDKMDDELPQLKNFILPGGTQAAASIHHARTVCRRAERLTVACGTEEEISELTVKYLNRLSDFLFMLGRYENFKSGKEDTPWIPR